MASEEVTLQNAVDAAKKALTTATVADSVDPSPANNAAVKALSERLATAEAALNAYLFPGGTGSTTTPIKNPPSTDVINPTVLGQELSGYFTGDNEGIGAFIAATGAQPAVPDAWNYFVKQVDDVFTDMEGLLEDTTATAFGVETDITVAEIAAGTTAEIAGWEVIAFGIAIILGQYVTGWILQKVGKYFPNPSIFGFRPLDFIQTGITNVGNQLAGAAENEAVYIVNIIIQPIRMLVGLFGRAINAIAGAHDKTARIVQHTVPSAVTEAKAYTDTQLTNQQQLIDNAAAQALAQLQPPPTVAEARTIIDNAHVYGGPVWYLEALAAAAIVSAGTYTDDTKTQTTAEIATAKAQAETDAQSAIQKAQADLISRLTGDETTLSALTNSLNVTIPNEIATQVNENNATENQKLTAATTALQTQIDGLQSQITTLANQNAAATTAIENAQSTISTLTNETDDDEGAIAAQQQIIATAQATIATNTTAISDLYTQITGISNTLAPIQAAQTLQTSQITSIESDLNLAIPTAIAALSTQITSLKTQVDECSVDNCDTTNPNNIRNVLRDLLGLFSAAAEIGFIHEAITDPLGTADALSPLLDSLGTSGANTLYALLDL